ncbi:MAG: alpha/beta hydrolase [Acidimicrobiia bacterium]|nr:alpha/beta hydrolase [Acidimicrobiia bacterium]
MEPVARRIAVNGTTLSVIDEGEGDAVVLLHGFPELAFSWRHQIPALVDAGYRVVAPDQRGYGAADHPDDVASYALGELAGDVVGLVNALDIESATVVGHDWGSIVAYTAAITSPDRFDRIVSLNVPYRGACWGFPTMEVIRSQLANRFGYVIMFHEGDAAEQGFAAAPEMWLNAFYLGGSGGREIHTEDEFAVYVEAFKAGGISGAVNWYRNIDANAEAFARYADVSIDQPTLLIAADSDPVLPLALTEGMDRWCANLERVVIADCAHWTQQERPDEVNVALIDWLDRTQ